MMEYAEGESEASPTPTPIRERASSRKVRPRPKLNEARDQNACPTTMSQTRLTRSASQPSGSPAMV